MGGNHRGDARRSVALGRGQTGFDFMVGMGVFLITLGLVLGHVPDLFQPFASDTGPDMVASDRSAARLAEDLLVEDVTSPGVLNETCTGEFFDADGITGTCRFDDDAADIHAALAVDTTTRVNVTIESEGSVHSLPGPVWLAVGDSPASTSEVVVANRLVYLEGQQLRLVVRVW